MRDSKSNGRSRFDKQWRTFGDYRAACEHCPWLRIERHRRPINRLAREHVEETGHTVEITVTSLTRVTPEPTDA